jgi:hypothetical protein
MKLIRLEPELSVVFLHDTEGYMLSSVEQIQKFRAAIIF